MAMYTKGNISIKAASTAHSKRALDSHFVMVKVIAGLVMLALSIVVLAIPLKLVMRSNRIPKMSRVAQHRWVVALQCVRCFSAGTLLGISFLHLMPDSRDVLVGALNADSSIIGHEFPIPELLFVIGLLFCLYVEKSVWSAANKRSNRRRHSLTGSYDFFDSDLTGTVFNQDTLTVIKAESETSINRISGINDASIFTEENVADTKVIYMNGHVTCDAQNVDEVTPMVKVSSVPLSLNSIALHVEDPEPTPSHYSGVAFNSCDDDERIVFEAPNLKSVLTSATVTFYGIFDGLAVGLQRTEMSSWIILVAVCIHRCFLAFVLGLEYERPDSNSKHILLGCLLFSLFPVFGICAGAIFENFARTGIMLKFLGVVQSFTTGAMLYTACFVIIYHEVKQNADFIPLTATLCGFSGAALSIGILLY